VPTFDSSTIFSLILIAFSLILLVLVVVLLVMSARRKRESDLWLREMADVTGDGLRELENAVGQQGFAQREEMLRTLQSVNDTLLNTFSSATQLQQSQLGAMQKQQLENEQAQEGRQYRLHRMTEDNLSKFEQRVKSLEQLLDQKLLQNENRLEKMRVTVEGGMQRMQTENAQKLEEMRKTVDEKLHETLDKRLGESFTQVSQRLEQVYQSLGEVHTLATGVGDLKRVLSNVKTRGIWGEIQLGNLLEQALTSSQYAQNVAVKPHSSERVEYAVCLPGKDSKDDKPVYLPIDSKFPQEDYARLAEASQQGDAQQVEAAQKALMNAVRIEAKRISEKYIEPPYTTDFAVMFLPLEGLYAEVMKHSDVVEQLQRDQRIVMAGPSTLLALLNSLQMGFRTLAIEQRSAEVWKLLSAVKTDFGNFAQVLQKTQDKLRQATDSIDSAFVRTRSIERKLRRVEAMDEQQSMAMLEDGDVGA
jgi:DNA recombination protein RmuC